MLVHSIDLDGCRGIEVEHLSAVELAICIFHYRRARTPCQRRTCKTRTALVCQYFAGRPTFTGMIVDDTVSARDAWSLTLGHSNRVAHNGDEVLAHVGVT